MPPEPRRRATAHDVARAAGVSQSAVSRSFTAGASVSADVRARVMAAAAELGYRPNLTARSLITRRSHTIGIAVSYMENQFYPSVLESLSLEFAKAGYRLLLFTGQTGQDSDPVLDTILHHQVDAVLLASTTLTSHFAEECQRAGVPVVLLNRRTESEAVSSVTGDNVTGGRAIARLLAERGHAACAFMAGLENSSTSQEREAGFSAGLAEAGLAPARREVGHYSFEGARAAMRRLLGAPNRPDAVFCANDHMALAALETARSEYSLLPGRDISIVGFDDVPLAGWPSFGLTTYSQPVGRMVEHVLAITLGHLQAEEYVPVREVVQGELVLRASVRP